MIPDWTLTIGEQTYDVLAKVEDNDYAWSADAVLRRHSDGALFFATDSGCSCAYFGEGLTEAGLKPIYKFEEALRLVDADDRDRLQTSFNTQTEVWR